MTHAGPRLTPNTHIETATWNHVTSADAEEFARRLRRHEAVIRWRGEATGSADRSSWSQLAAEWLGAQ